METIGKPRKKTPEELLALKIKRQQAKQHELADYSSGVTRRSEKPSGKPVATPERQPHRGSFVTENFQKEVTAMERNKTLQEESLPAQRVMDPEYAKLYTSADYENYGYDDHPDWLDVNDFSKSQHLLAEQEASGAITLVEDIHAWDEFEESSKSHEGHAYIPLQETRRDSLHKEAIKNLEHQNPELYEEYVLTNTAHGRHEYPRNRLVNWLYNKFLKSKKDGQLDREKIRKFMDDQNHQD